MQRFGIVVQRGRIAPLPTGITQVASAESINGSIISDGLFAAPSWRRGGAEIPAHTCSPHSTFLFRGRFEPRLDPDRPFELCFGFGAAALEDVPFVLEVAEADEALAALLPPRQSPRAPLLCRCEGAAAAAGLCRCCCVACVGCVEPRPSRFRRCCGSRGGRSSSANSARASASESSLSLSLPSASVLVLAPPPGGEAVPRGLLDDGERPAEGCGWDGDTETSLSRRCIGCVETMTSSGPSGLPVLAGSSVAALMTAE